MKTELINLFIFLAICFVGYLLFRNLDFKEGFGSSSAPQTSTKTPTSSTSSSTPSNTSVTNGIAGNSAPMQLI
jgi:hypothetical protein